MDLAKELLAQVLRERIKQQHFSAGDDDAKLGSVLAQTDRLLAEGAPICIHLLMGHTNCKATEREFCEATQTLEVWTFKMQREVPSEATAGPPMLPLFLRQAVRSQLHFSPFRSWLTAQKDAGPSNGLCPLIRVSPASDFAAPSVPCADWLQCHQFPPCLVPSSLPIVNGASLRVVHRHSSAGEPFWLRVHVQWLKKEHFLTKAPICPKKRMEERDGLWMSPPTDRCHSRLSCTSVERNGEDDGDDHDYAMSGTESDDYDSSQCLTPTESPSPIVRRKTADFKEGDDLRKAFGRKSGSKVKDEKRGAEGVNGSGKMSDGIALERRKTTLNGHQQKRAGKGPGERMAEQKQDKEEQTNGGVTLGRPTHSASNSHPTTPSSIRPVFCLNATAPMLRKNKRNGPPPVDGVHLAKEIGGVCTSFAERNGEERKGSIAHWPQQQKTQQHPFPTNGSMATPPRVHDSKRTWRTPSRLVCNFEESILNGRIPANSVVSGFHLQLTVIGSGASANGYTPLFPASKRLTLPVLTYFFNDLMTQIPGRSPMAMPPSPLHLARCELEAETIPIPRRCTLQIVLLRPCGSVVKLFMVEVDVLDMPSSSRTFIRQRIFSGNNSKATGEKDTGKTTENGHKTGGGGSANVPNAKTSSDSLRFLVHLRLASDASGQAHLHSDIRILFSNKANDLEGLGSIIEKANSVYCCGAAYEKMDMRSMAQMPQTPKYSPIK